MTPEQELGSLVSNAFAGQTGSFRPCAIYQERMDSIRVVVRDCSLTATRINDLVTVLEDTYYKPGRGVERYVGFTLKGVKRFCEKIGIATVGPVKLGEILDGIIQEFPDQQIEMAIDGIARRFVDETEVDLNSSNVVVMPQKAA